MKAKQEEIKNLNKFIV